MDLKEIIDIRKKWSYILTSSVFVLLLILAFPVLTWKEFSPELTHLVGKAPSDSYYLFSEEVHGSFLILISAIALVVISVLVFRNTRNERQLTKGLRIAYLITGLVFISSIASSGGDSEYSVLGPTFTSSIASFLALIGIGIMLYDTYKLLKSRNSNPQ